MQILNNIKLVVFDLDDTLYPELSYAKAGFKNVALSLTNNDQTLSDQWTQKMLAWQKEGSRDIFQKILKQTNNEPTEAAVQNLINIYRLSDRQLSLHKDADQAINFCNHFAKTAILTDGYYEAQRKKVSWLALEKRVDKIIYTDELGQEYWKPSTKCFEMLSTQFAIKPIQCAYIADNEQKDFAGPNKLGWRTVKIIRPDGVYRDKLTNNPNYKPKCTINSLNELSNI